MADDDGSDAGGGNGTIVLPERLDMNAAIRLREDLLACDGDVTLDAAAVDVVTSPGFQVLMAARDRQRGRGRAMRLLGVSGGFVACAATLGVPIDRMQTSGDRG